MAYHSDSCHATALSDNSGGLVNMIDQAPSLIWVIDTNQACIWCNQTCRAFTGYDMEAIQGSGWLQAIHPDDLAACQSLMVRQFEQRRPFRIEYRLKRHDGEYRWMLGLGQPSQDSKDIFQGYVCTSVDITEHKRSAEMILESKTLLQAVIDAIPDWIYVKDEAHRFLLVNAQCASAFNATPSDMVGQSDTVFIPSVLRFGEAESCIEKIHADDDAVLAGQSIYLPQDAIIFGNEEVRIFETSKKPMRDSFQRISGNLCYRRDITERVHKKQEQELLATQLRQAQKMELIGHLTGGIAHDFNNILSAVFGYAELIQMLPESRKNEQIGLYVQEILQAGIRAKELVAQLLTFSHRREMTDQAIDVTTIIKEVAKLLRSTVPSSISIDCILEAPLPEALISAVQLHQTLMNLGVNARDAMGGEGKMEIRAALVELRQAHACASCHTHFSGEYLMISVRDNGCGISLENLPRIFDPFFTTKEVGQGSGLGLSVLHGIVHSANGHIDVSTAPGYGTEFRIYLPPHASETLLPCADIKPESHQAYMHGNVMVVDDEASILRFMTLMLQKLGCTVIGHTSARQALEYFQHQPKDIDLVITDQTMPELNGLELARAMLALRPDLPVVVSTGYSHVIDEDSLRQVGISRLLMKPVPAKVLSDVVKEYLARASGAEV